MVDNMVDAHCVLDEAGFTVHWLVVAFHSVRVRIRVGYIYNLKSVPTMSSKAVRCPRSFSSTLVLGIK